MGQSLGSCFIILLFGGARTSLHWCCDRGWLTIAELLLSSGAPVNACTKQGDTPMLWAAKSGHVKVVELLLKSGSDPLLRNNRDEAALDVAVDEVVRTLISDAVPEKISSAETTVSAPPVQKTEDDPQPEKSVDVKEKAPVSSESSMPRMPSGNLGSRALAGLPMGGKVGTSGGALFSAYNKQPLSSTSGIGSGPGPKKMKITLKKK